MDRKFLLVSVMVIVATLTIAGIGTTLADTNTNKDINKTQHVQKSSLSYIEQIQDSQWSNIEIDIEPPEDLEFEDIEDGPGRAEEIVVYNPKTGEEQTFEASDINQSGNSSGTIGLLQNFNAIQQRDPVDERGIDAEFRSSQPQQKTHGSNDGRVRITPTTSYPWRAVGYLSTGCTASLIEPDVILTAGHCVNDGADGGWYNNIKFFPGRDKSTKPFGHADWIKAVTYKKWADNGAKKYDLAIVELDRNIGNQVGWLGRMARGSNHGVYKGIVNTAGYPGDKPGISMQFDADQGQGAGTHFHRIDMSVWKGQSGSPVWAYYPNSNACPGCRYVTSVVTYHGNPAWANRLNPNKYDHLNNWMNKYFSAPTPQTNKAHGPSKDHPDLVDDGKQWSSVTPQTTSSGEQITIEHDIRNIGTAQLDSGDIDRGINIQYYLSDDKEIDSTDTQIGQNTAQKQIKPFRYIDVQTELGLPESIENGNYNLCFNIDSTNDIPEFNEENNDACLDEQIQITRQFTISTNDPTPPGNTVEIEITAENVGGISISDIPMGWTINSTQNDGGIFASNDENNDGHNESAGWAWANKGTYNPTMTLNVPSNAVEQNYTLNSSIQNGDSITKQFTIEVGKTDYDQDGDGEIEGNEVRQGIRCFLFGSNNCIGPRLGGQQIRDLIIRFLGI